MITAKFSYAGIEFTVSGDTSDEVYFHFLEVHSKNWRQDAPAAPDIVSDGGLELGPPQGKAQLFDRISIDDRGQFRLWNDNFPKFGVIVVNPKEGWSNIGLQVNSPRKFSRPIQGFVFEAGNKGKRVRIDE